MSYQWLPNRQNANEELPNVGLKGDSIHAYHECSNNSAAYTQRILVIDPSGRGSNETGWAVLFALNGYIFLMEAGGCEGYDAKSLEFLAKKAKRWDVREVVYEGNFGDGMFGNVFEPVLLKHHKCSLEEVKSKGQKEVRICDTLEPVVMNHRLIIRYEAIKDDYASARDRNGKHDVKFSLFYQFTRISRDKGALPTDDRLDALAIGVGYLKETMQQDSKLMEDERMADFIEEHMSREVFKAGAVKHFKMNGVDFYYEDDDREGVSIFDNW